MKTYEKIETVFNRDIEGTKKLIIGDFRYSGGSLGSSKS